LCNILLASATEFDVRVVTAEQDNEKLATFFAQDQVCKKLVS